jgi:hypothetical protein
VLAAADPRDQGGLADLDARAVVQVDGAHPQAADEGAVGAAAIGEQEPGVVGGDPEVEARHLGIAQHQRARRIGADHQLVPGQLGARALVGALDHLERELLHAHADRAPVEAHDQRVGRSDARARHGARVTRIAEPIGSSGAARLRRRTPKRATLLDCHLGAKLALSRPPPGQENT